MKFILSSPLKVILWMYKYMGSMNFAKKIAMFGLVLMIVASSLATRWLMSIQNASIANLAWASQCIDQYYKMWWEIKNVNFFFFIIKLWNDLGYHHILSPVSCFGWNGHTCLSTCIVFGIQYNSYKVYWDPCKSNCRFFLNYSFDVHNMSLITWIFLFM